MTLDQELASLFAAHTTACMKGRPADVRDFETKRVAFEARLRKLVRAAQAVDAVATVARIVADRATAAACDAERANLDLLAVLQ